MLLLTACAGSAPARVVTVDRPVALRAPAELRSCGAEPVVPPRPVTSDQAAIYVLREAAWGRDCAATLAERNAWEDAAAARLEHLPGP